jgi:hypothetical protein
VSAAVFTCQILALMVCIAVDSFSEVTSALSNVVDPGMKLCEQQFHCACPVNWSRRNTGHQLPCVIASHIRAITPIHPAAAI